MSKKLVGTMLTPFRTDKCSMFPQGDYSGCCVTHDRSYHPGGTKEQRRAADIQLLCCVALLGRPLLGCLMFIGVRIGGMPIFPFPWRWGYGRRYSESWKYDEEISS